MSKLHVYNVFDNLTESILTRFVYTSRCGHLCALNLCTNSASENSEDQYDDGAFIKIL